jgi:hypothetical protein
MICWNRRANRSDIAGSLTQVVGLLDFYFDGQHLRELSSLGAATSAPRAACNTMAHTVIFPTVAKFSICAL